ncbi:MAG: hypothetical protein KJT03_14005 [Verrucomicrobiae bacterium]|nr:hypothetical protein [Verrucomicrobiae bacterium]
MTVKTSIFFLLFLQALVVCGQVPVPDRDNRANPFSGNPLQSDTPSPEEEGARGRLVQNRVFGDLFGTGLPSFFTEGDLRLRLNPKLGDFFEDEYVRFPVGLEYNFSNYFEAFADVGTYFPNPFNSGGGWGTYNLRVGGKYSWWGFANTDYNVSLGFNSDMPWSDPPLEVTDGWARHEPFIAVSRELNTDQPTLAYLNIGYEFVGTSPFKSNPVSPRPKNRVFLRPGVIYYPGGNYRYSAEIEYRTSMFDTRTPEPSDYTEWVGTPEYTRAFEEVHEIIFSPGITWFPTAEFRRGFFVPGNWDIGFKLDIPVIEETDEDLGLSVRFRWYYDYDDYLKTQFKKLWPFGGGDEEKP